MLTLGYKASAEQFGPRRLLDLAVAAEGLGHRDRADFASGELGHLATAFWYSASLTSRYFALNASQAAGSLAVSA